MAAFVRDFAPDQIIQFSPDHFHGFHYGMMPSFCVGTAARSYGDYGTQTGDLRVNEAFALDLLGAVRDADIDAAVSFDMVVDHGFVQIWQTMFGRFDDLPIVPVFVNAIGRPLPKYRRVRQLGEAVGHFAAASGKRILFAASGGLSHDPIVPDIRIATPELRNRLIGRAVTDPYQQKAREKAVFAAGEAAMRGEGPSRPLNPDWDQRFLALLSAADWEALDQFDPDDVDREAGCGGNEVLAWVAATAALAASGPFEVVQQDYLAIPGWIAGMGHFAAIAR